MWILFLLLVKEVKAKLNMIQPPPSANTSSSFSSSTFSSSSDTSRDDIPDAEDLPKTQRGIGGDPTVGGEGGGGGNHGQLPLVAVFVLFTIFAICVKVVMGFLGDSVS